MTQAPFVEITSMLTIKTRPRSEFRLQITDCPEGLFSCIVAVLAKANLQSLGNTRHRLGDTKDQELFPVIIRSCTAFGFLHPTQSSSTTPGGLASQNIHVHFSHGLGEYNTQLYSKGLEQNPTNIISMTVTLKHSKENPKPPFPSEKVLSNILGLEGPKKRPGDKCDTSSLYNLASGPENVDDVFIKQKSKGVPCDKVYK